jgi:carboxylesterase type B
MQSGQTSFNNLENSNTSAWDTLMSRLNCKGSNSETLSCARAANAYIIKIIEEDLALAFRPVSDNVTQLEFPEAARAAGNIAKVPILTGTTAQEGRVFAIGQTNVTAFLLSAFPGLPPSFYQAVLAAYPEGAPGLKNGYEIISQISTDAGFQCPCAALANSSSIQANIPTWRYYFNATFPNTQFPFLDLGVYHSSELPIVFGTYPRWWATVREANLSNYMQTAWAEFAKHPMRGPGFREWPNIAVLGTAGKALESDTGARALDARCALYQPFHALAGV